MNTLIQLRSIQLTDCSAISDAFAAQGWKKPISQYEKYFREQEEGIRDVIIAERHGHFVGYATIVWQSRYKPFHDKGIPEIVDLNVLQKYQRRGFGNLLLESVENKIDDRSKLAGIGVGITSDYAAAHRLYLKRGYLPDGKGLTYDTLPVKHGDKVTINDFLVLYLIKRLK